MAQKRTLRGQLVDVQVANQPRSDTRLPHECGGRLELLYISRGEGRYTAADRACPLRRGSVVICGAGAGSGTLSGWEDGLECCRCVYRDVSLSDLPEAAGEQLEKIPVLFFDAEQSRLEQTVFSLYEQRRKTGVENGVCHILGSAVLTLVLDRLSGEDGLAREERTLQNEALVKEVIAYIDSHLHEAPNLSQMAEHFYISTSHLSHVVKKAAGISPIRYMLVRRFAEAQNLLMNTSMSVREICKCLGFADSTYFSRSFKKMVGITPTEYRRTVKAASMK